MYSNPMTATINVVERSKDAEQLIKLLKKGYKDEHTIADIGYCKVLKDDKAITVTNRQGQTLAQGQNVSVNQVLDFILRKFW